jgi:plastocyanin
MSATVTYNGSTFSPSSVTIAKGGTVNFVATNGQSMWVASAPHPTHTGYDGTSESVHCAAGYTGPAPFDMCAAGTSFSFTFDKTGSFVYHNHLNTSAHGTVVVQ